MIMIIYQNTEEEKKCSEKSDSNFDCSYVLCNFCCCCHHCFATTFANASGSVHSIPNILPNWSGNSSSVRIGAAAAADVKKSGKRLEELEELRRSMGTTTLLSWHAKWCKRLQYSGNLYRNDGESYNVFSSKWRT